MRAAHVVAALGTAFVLLYGGFVLGQQSAPTDYKLVSEDVLAAIDLAKEIDSVEGRELRLSSAVIAPGGHVGLHSHSGDPTIVYMLSGVLTNHHDDGTTEEFRTGETDESGREGSFEPAHPLTENLLLSGAGRMLD
jgi:hypothetical protein